MPKKIIPIVNSKVETWYNVPNIIHSLDATHLINLINKSHDQGFTPIITVHDCFGTLPNNMKKNESHKYE